ncbi:MAG: efflux RND transporter periplasmic adaptor subunit [Deltaproteobacteria bacterium]|nr:MAG: efflux RND transporter periplasmic adaptor subunit [Deltaproteobacteria bacterium]
MTIRQWCLAGLRYGLMLCGLIFLGQLAATAFKAWSPAADQPQYLFATVARGPLETLVSSTGTLAALETVEVGTQVSGTIASIAVDYNDRVRKGQVLAVLDQALFTAQVREAEANVDKARAALTQAEDEFQRNRPLFDKGFLSAREFLPVRIGVDTARAALAAAEAGLARARTNLAYTVIRSPIDGTVIKRSVEAGQTVAASLNTPTLFLIARDLGHMRIEADVDESDIGRIRTGQAVRFTVQSHPAETFHGTVSQIRLQPRTIANVVNYTVLIDAKNDKGLLLPGMTATIDFVVSRVTDALLVPNAALRFQPPAETAGKGQAPEAPARQDDDRSGRLYTLAADGRLHSLPVTRGETDGVKTVVSGPDLRDGLQVVSGLKPAERAARGNFFSFLRPPRGAGGPR